MSDRAASLGPTLYYRTLRGDGTVALHIGDPEIATLLETFHPLNRIGRAAADGAAEIRLEPGGPATGSGYRLIGPSGAWEVERAGVAAAYCEAELSEALLDGLGDYLTLHGAAVTDGRRCVLLLGPSGSGKSTLALGLDREGLRALCDEPILLEPLSVRLTPHGRPIRVHRQGYTQLGAPSPPAGVRVCEPYLWLQPSTTRTPVPPVSDCVFLERGGTTRLEPIAAPEALRRLLVSRFEIGAPARDFESIRALSLATRAYALVHRSLPGALDALRSVFADAAPRAAGPAHRVTAGSRGGD